MRYNYKLSQLEIITLNRLFALSNYIMFLVRFGKNKYWNRSGPVHNPLQS
jgi:hypothetical protein